MRNGIVVFGALTLMLTGCGGGGGGGSSSTVSATTSATATPAEAGVYSGTLSFPDGSSENSYLLLAPNNKYIAINSDNTYDTGTISYQGDKFQGGVREWDGSQWNSGTISGQTSTKQVSGQANYGGSVTSTLSFTRSSTLSDIPASIAKISKTWTQSGSQPLTITIQSDGTLTGSDTTGCVLNGSVSAPDASVNVYQFNVDVSNCPSTTRGSQTYTASQVNGTYTGLGYVSPGTSSSGSDELIIVLDNTVVATGVSVH